MPGADTRYSNANSARPRRARATIVLAAVAAMALLSSCNWAQPGFGPEGQRYNPFEHTISVANVATLAPAWTVPTDGTIGGPVLDDGGHVYFTRSQGNLVSVRSLSATTGATIWDTNLPTHEMFAIATPAILAGGRVWASRLLPDGTTPTLAVDRLDTATGAIVDSTTAVRIPERLVSGNGVVAAVEYLGTDSAQLVVRDLSTAQQLWASSGLAGSWVIGPISNGVITIMGDEGELRGYPITCGAATCDPLWTRHLQNSVTGRAAAGDRLIVATATRILRDHNGEPMGLDHSTLNALSMTTGETLWTGTNIVSAGGISIAGDTA
ncbi:MAG TPA: PQQ-binding-like beta-propeller repeat protein [Acidimicrobiales bacterium]